MKDPKEIKDDYWRILESTNEWIRFSDQKAGILLTVYGVIVTVIYSNSDTVYLALSKSYYQIFLTIVTVLLSGISITYAFLCLNPSLKNSNPKSIIYFGHVQAHNKSCNEYIQNSKAILEDDTLLIEQEAEQVYINSTIAWKKFRFVSLAIRFYFLSIFTLLLSLFMYLFL
ncbi:MAG: DUF5706 domain-containing protein [Sporocytophaga sp.]|nr:DUF5706 domain-containing protein [Sporocytophaga sp.]